MDKLLELERLPMSLMLEVRDGGRLGVCGTPLDALSGVAVGIAIVGVGEDKRLPNVEQLNTMVGLGQQTR